MGRLACYTRQIVSERASEVHEAGREEGCRGVNGRCEVPDLCEALQREVAVGRHGEELQQGLQLLGSGAPRHTHRHRQTHRHRHREGKSAGETQANNDNLSLTRFRNTAPGMCHRETDASRAAARCHYGSHAASNVQPFD